MGKTFAEWKDEISDETARLAAARPYLSEEGEMRLHAFRVVEDSSSFCKTAAELIGYLAEYEEMCRKAKTPENASALEEAAVKEMKKALWDLKSHHLSGCLSELRQIAKSEEDKN